MSNPKLIAEDMDLLNEDVNSKMPQLLAILKSKNSKYASYDDEKLTNWIMRLAQSDPTPNQKYIIYIVTQFKFGNLRLEDAPRLGEDIKEFNNITRSSRLSSLWTGKQQLPEYKNWRELDDHISEFKAKYGEIDSTRNAEEKWKKGAKVILDSSIKTKSGTKNIKIYKITSPHAAVIYGYGTRWCTSMLSPKPYGQSVLEPMTHGGKTGFPTTAQTYLRRGPLYIIYIDSSPVFQADSNFAKFMDVNDRSARAISPFTDLLLSEFYKVPEIANSPSAIANINKNRDKCINPNYPNRVKYITPENSKQGQTQDDEPVQPAQVQPAQPQAPVNHLARLGLKLN